jgi:hypothetical protein
LADFDWWSSYEFRVEQCDLYIQFDGVKFVQKRIEHGYIRYLNLLSIMESEGYGMCDSLYYVREEGEGLHGLELVNSNYKVEEMLRKYESSKKLVLTIMRDKRKSSSIVLSPVKKQRIHRKQQSQIDLDPDEEEPSQFVTQDNVNCELRDTQVDEHIPLKFDSQYNLNWQNKDGVDEDMEEEKGQGSDEGSDSWTYPCQYDRVKADEMRRKEAEKVKALVAEKKRLQNDPLTHCEGDTDVEDIYDCAVETEECVREDHVKKTVKKQGPALRSHSQVEKKVVPDWAPSNDEVELGFLKEEDDDGFEPLPFTQPKGRKSRAKKAKERVWYDETRQNPEQQLMLKLCFRDAYQFREALSRLHIVQLRNFHYHRNCPDRIIVWCKEKEKYGCEFYMVAALIKNEKTFCIKKMHLHHSCPTEPSSNRINSSFLSTTYVDKFKADINTGISCIQEKAKKEFGVDVPKRMAYRARTKAQQLVLGDHKK